MSQAEIDEFKARLAAAKETTKDLYVVVLLLQRA